MIIPSRWMTGGKKKLDSFRSAMLADTRIRLMHDYINPKECFPNNDIKGGVCFFLWDRDYQGECDITSHTPYGIKKSRRYLKEDGFDIFIREQILVDISKKIALCNDKTLDCIVSARKPYGLEAETMQSASKFGLPEFSDKKIKDGFEILGLDEKNRRIWKYLPKDYPLPKRSICIDKYKVFIAESYGKGLLGEVPSTPVIGSPKQICSETFLEIGPFESSQEAENLIKYIKTKFFRALIGIQKRTQHTTKKVYRFVPLVSFKSDDIDWNKPISEIDEQLYVKYGLSDSEISFIEDNIQEMA